jgi:uncharacterized protein YqjF (DUF2071 family)
MAMAENSHLASCCLCLICALHRSCIKTTSGAVSTQYWIPVDHFSTRLDASVQERKGEVIQGLSRPQAIHSLEQNFTSAVMRAYLGCHSEIRALNALATVVAV